MDMRLHFLRSCAAALCLATIDCSRLNSPDHGPAADITTEFPFPDFITANEDYYITRIGSVPEVNADSFRLEITGLVKTPRSFSLGELMALPRVELPLTVECIGSNLEISLVSTAVWTGFRLYDLLESLGLDSSATGVKYRCADGYYASHTIDQIKNNGIIGALFMNGDTIPPEHGFPLRILNPGYYGVKQPAWVVSIEVSAQPPEDYWTDRGWDVTPPMAIDSKIFFPPYGSTIARGDTLYVGGAAYGGTRVDKVEVTADGGATWKQAEIVKSLDADNVWVFWLAWFVFRQPEAVLISARATDIHGNSQPETDTVSNNGWPTIYVTVAK